MTGRILKVTSFVLLSLLFSSCVNLFSVFTPREAAGTSNPEELVALGQYYMQSMEYEKAYDAYSKALEIDPDNALALEGAGASYFYMKIGATNVLRVALGMVTNSDSSNDMLSTLDPLINIQDLYSAFHYMSGNYEKIVSGGADATLSKDDSSVVLFYLVSAGLDTMFQLVDLDGDGVLTNDPDDFFTFTNLNPFVSDASNAPIAGVPLLFESTGLDITNDLNDLVDHLTNGTNSFLARTNEFIGAVSNDLQSNFYALFTNDELSITNDVDSLSNRIDSITNNLDTVTNSLEIDISNVVSNTLEQTNDVVDQINADVESVSNWVTNEVASISNWVINKSNSVVTEIGDLTNDISTNVDNLDNDMTAFTNDLRIFTNDVNDYLSTNDHTNLLFDAWNAADLHDSSVQLDSDYRSITNSLADLTNRVNELPQDVTNLVDSNVTEINDYVDSGHANITNYVTTNITKITNYLYSEVDRITNELRENLTNLIASNLQPILDDILVVNSNIDHLTNRLGDFTNRLNEILDKDVYTMFSNFIQGEGMANALQPYLDDFLTNDDAYLSLLSNPGASLLFKIPDVQRRLTNRIRLVKELATNLMLNLQSSNLRSMIAPVVDPILDEDSFVSYIENPVSYFMSTNSSITDTLFLSVTTNLIETIFDSTNSSPDLNERDVIFRKLFKNAIPALSDSFMSNFNLDDFISNMDVSSLISNLDIDSYLTNEEISNYLSYTNMDILLDQYFSNAMTNVDLSSVFDSVESNIDTVQSNLSDTNNLMRVSASDLLSGVTYPSNVSAPSGMDSGFNEAMSLMSDVNRFAYLEPILVDSNNSGMVDAVTANSNTRESNTVIFMTNQGLNNVSDLYNSLTNREPSFDTTYGVDTSDGINSSESNRIIQRSIEFLTNGYDDLTNVNVLIEVMTNTYQVDGFLWSALDFDRIRFELNGNNGIRLELFSNRVFRREDEIGVLG